MVQVSRNPLTGLIVLLFFSAFTLYSFRNYLIEGRLVEDYIFGGDGMGHVFKVSELASRIDQGVFVDWTDAWYLGYHPYHFYPSLSYVIYATLARIFGDVGLAVRTGIALSFLLSLIGMHMVSMEIMRLFRFKKSYSHIVSIAVAVYYAYHPYMVSFITFVCDIPAAYAFSFLPLSFFFYLRTIRQDRGFGNLVMCSSFLALAFLAHSFVGFFAALSIGMHFIIRLVFSRDEVKREIPRIFLIAVFFLGLVSFWVVPFYYEGEALANISGYEWTMPISSVEFTDFFNFYAKSGWSPFYIGLGAICILVLSAINGDRRRENLIFILMLLASMYMSLGVNAPLNFLNPLLRLGVYPNRALVLCIFAAACGLSCSMGSLLERVCRFSSIWKKRLGFAACFIGFLLVLLDSSSINPAINLSPPTLGFKEVCDFIRLQNRSDGRVLFIGSDSPLFSYSPVLTGRNLVDGYYLQGSKIAYWTEECKSFAIAKNETLKILKRYEDFNVEYVIVDKGWLNFLSPLLESNLFHPVYENENYVVFVYLGYKGMFQPAESNILVIGDEHPSLIVKSILEKGNSNLTVTLGYSPYVDDYSLEDLDYEAIVLYAFTYHKRENAESLLRMYADKGKLLVIDLDGFHYESVSIAEGEFLGVHFQQELIYDDLGKNSWGKPLNVTYSAFYVNNSFSNAVYSGNKPWYAMTYEGLDKTIVEINGLYKSVGMRGNITFVGLNLFYHALLYDNPAEIEALTKICTPENITEKHRFAYNIVKDTPAEKIYWLSSERVDDVLVSLAFSPHLQVFVNDKPTKVTVQNNLMRLRIPEGESYIKIKYATTPIHLVGYGVTIATAILPMWLWVSPKFKRTGKNKSILHIKPQ